MEIPLILLSCDCDSYSLEEGSFSAGCTPTGKQKLPLVRPVNSSVPLDLLTNSLLSPSNFKV